MLMWGTTWLRNELTDHASQRVRYIRENEVNEELPVTFGDTDEVQLDRDGIIPKAHQIEFLIPAANFVLNGKPIEPQTGDRVQWVHPIWGDVIEWEVMPEGTEPADAKWDRHEMGWRVPAKQVYASEGRADP